MLLIVRVEAVPAAMRRRIQTKIPILMILIQRFVDSIAPSFFYSFFRFEAVEFAVWLRLFLAEFAE
jgi:hypothetical protein